MFERLERRARRAAERRARAVVEDMVERLRAELPSGVEASAAPEGVRVTGRRLMQRYVLDAALRQILAGRGR